jgi:thioredoxin 1
MQYLTQNNFQKTVAHGNVVVKFTAAWCQPCQAMQPVLDAIQQKYSKSIAFRALDADQYISIAEQYGVEGLPTLLFFKQGKVAGRSTGVLSSKQLEQKLGAIYER